MHPTPRPRLCISGLQLVISGVEARRDEADADRHAEHGNFGKLGRIP